ncbi:hypothetical protein FJT64_008358 [Amphibalanus amphitrite]|uniref:Uncharacterized protein n=2 Tax=Amphibalanus amphitrite TaxID=1232801 RepID=A0A6A4VX54_AMPAM|nr:hypothetical protein FJT64_008358 [Amphibalanus amphitrite]
MGDSGRGSIAGQSTDQAAAMAATSMDGAANCPDCPSCNDLAAEMEQREYERRLMEQYSDSNGRVCTCAKCQERFHELYRQMNDDSALPMATPMLMQDVLSDGLAFCVIQ